MGVIMSYEANRESGTDNLSEMIVLRRSNIGHSGQTWLILSNCVRFFGGNDSSRPFRHRLSRRAIPVIQAANTEMQSTRLASKFLPLLAVALLGGRAVVGANATAEETPAASFHSLAELQSLAATNHQAIASFSVTGVVCTAEIESRLMTLQDSSATVLLELPQLDPDVRPGHWLVLTGHQLTVSRSLFGLQLGTAPVAEVDQLHPPLTRSGRLPLAAGLHPIRMEWFNGYAVGSLDLTYEGPGVSPQIIPPFVLQCRPSETSGADEFQPGLNFATYVGSNWTMLPDFKTLKPVAQGIVANIEVGNRAQLQQVGMVFTGFLQISNSGIYTFHLRSDDGARLFVGDPTARCASTKLERPLAPPVPKDLSQALLEGNKQEWVSLEGTVTFASRRGNQIELEIMDRDQPVSALVINGVKPFATNLVQQREYLVQQRVQVRGIRQLPHETRTPRIIVPGPAHLRIISRPATVNTDALITTAVQVRGLQPDDARKPLRARVRGVVTMATYWSCVLQDLTGAVFVRHYKDAWPQQPVTGELWEFEGMTDPGDFSPIVRTTNAICLGNSVLPEPIHPTWEQLVNGSMDAELVEIQGVVVETSATEMTLLTRDGKVKILEKNNYPLPYNTAWPVTSETLPGSVVRVRGVFAACWDTVHRQLIPGQFYLGAAQLSVDEPAPDNPFSAATKRVTDLLLFTSHAGALTRFKVAGQVLYAQPREYFLLDGASGLRVHTKEPHPLAEGDVIEAVGFPQLGGPAPVMLEAKARKIGSAPRPTPVALSIADLANERNDAMLVQVEATLSSDVVRLGERVLELRAGPHHFLARLRTNGQPAAGLRRGSQVRLTGVYACTREGATGNDPDKFELLLNRATDIVVLQHGPWWTTRHTILTIAILLVGLAASLVWVALLRRTVAQRTARLEKEIRERQQIEQRRLLEQERTRVAQDLHDDLGAGLAQIGLIGSLAQRPNTSLGRAQDHLFEITERSRDMITVLDEIVWAINPKHDSATSVGSYLCDYAQDFLRPTTIACRLDVAHAYAAQMLNSTRRHQLFLAFKEALTNVIKHAQASEVWIRITTTDGEIKVTVEDNGKGFSPGTKTTNGDGTQNMHSRLEQIGGRCEIRSGPNGGTIVSFHLPTHPKTTI
jgi:signal transduction histidine kinase